MIQELFVLNVSQECFVLAIQLCLTLWGLQSARLLCPWNFPGKNTGVGCISLLQGILLTQGSNPVSCIAGRFFIICATRETRKHIKNTTEPHPNPLTQAAGAQESESPLILRWILAAHSSFQTIHLEFPWLFISLLVSLLLECVIATLNNSFQHSPNVF